MDFESKRDIPLDTILLALLKIGGVSDAKIVGRPHSSASHLWYLSEDEHELVGSVTFGESFCFIQSPRLSSGQWELGRQASAASDPGGCSGQSPNGQLYDRWIEAIGIGIHLAIWNESRASRSAAGNSPPGALDLSHGFSRYIFPWTHPVRPRLCRRSFGTSASPRRSGSLELARGRLR